MRYTIITMVICIVLITYFAPVVGQTVESKQDVSSTELQQLKEQLEKLKAEHELKLQELGKLINDIMAKMEKAEQEDELQKLLKEAKQLESVERTEETGIGKRFHTGVRQQQKLNPNITIEGDFFNAVSSSKNAFISDPSDLSYGNNGFFMRELQINLASPLDPFTRGKAFVSFTKDGITVEEAYMEWLNLPLNMNLKMGIFYSEFGALNRWHDHALPQFDRPKVLVNNFSNLGLGGFGMNANFMLPQLLFADENSLDLAVINGGNGVSFTNQGKDRLIYIAHLNNYYDISRDTYFEWSLSGAAGKNDPAEEYNSYVGSLAFTYKWVPIGRAKYRTIDWKTEFIFNHREDPIKNVNSKGFYTSLKNKMNARYWLGGRIGYSELPYDNTQSEWDFTVCVDFWQSEFVMVRYQYQYSIRDFNNVLNYPGAYPNDSSFIFHVSWAMGPHKHEAY